MNFTINCSLGELLDKITILDIKLIKCTDNNQLKNIKKELNLIKTNEINNLLIKNHKLVNELQKVNQELWNLEDLIREKSVLQDYGVEYIYCSESIHKKNDERYRIKKQINQVNNSSLFEEKIYKNTIKNDDNLNNIKNIVITQEDRVNLELGKNLYTNGIYYESLQIIKNIMEKFSNYDKFNSFHIDLLFSYSNICGIFNRKFPYFDKLITIMKNIELLPISLAQKNFVNPFLPVNV